VYYDISEGRVASPVQADAASQPQVTLQTKEAQSPLPPTPKKNRCNDPEDDQLRTIHRESLKTANLQLISMNDEQTDSPLKDGDSQLKLHGAESFV